MLNSLVIKNFRLFEEISIHNLKKINLIIGKNNSGKSCLLEAIELYATDASGSVFRQLLQRRGEYMDYNRPNETQWRDSPIKYFFHGYEFPKQYGNVIEIGPEEEHERLRIGIAPHRIVVNQETGFRTIEPGYDQLPLFEELNENVSLQMSKGNENQVIILLSKNRMSVGSLFRPRWDKHTANIQVVSSSGIDYFTVAKLWDQVFIEGNEKFVTDALNMLVPSIQSVGFFGDSSSRQEGRFPIVKIKEKKERIPLGSMGGGIKRLFHIALAIASIDSGYLLIDEIDNGLHWSVQEDLWKLIFFAASQKNIQVFATTHSMDCIKSFHRAWKDNVNHGTCIRLERKSDDIVTPTNLPWNRLSDALDTSVEMR